MPRDEAFLGGLVREPSESILQQIAGWDRSDILLKLRASVQDVEQRHLPASMRKHLDRIGFFEPPSNEDMRHLERFAHPFDAHLMKLCRFFDHLGIVIDEDPGVTSVSELARIVERRMVDQLRRMEKQSFLDRSLRRAKNEFSGNSIEEATAFVIRKLFDQVARDFGELSGADKRRAAAKILDAIDRLDQKTQAEIREKLKVDQLGVDALLKTGALATIGSSIGLAVAAGGFGSYTLLTSTISTVAGLVGLTLPFKFYLLATSTLAFVSNPVTIGVAIFGGGWLLRKKANQSIRDQYLNVLVALSVTAHGNPSPYNFPVDQFVEHAKRRYQEFCSVSGADLRLYSVAFPAFRKNSGR